MKKILFLVMIIMLAVMGVNAQPPINDEPQNPQKAEKIKALYVAYITQQLNLSVEEAQKFWPIHTQFDEEIRAANSSNLPEIEKEEAVLKAKKKYTASFTKILGAERVNKFLIVDKSFRDRIRNRLNEVRQQRKQKMPNENRQRGRNKIQN